jgi:peptide/nickel transport system substrate-binding protein
LTAFARCDTAVGGQVKNVLAAVGPRTVAALSLALIMLGTAASIDARHAAGVAATPGGTFRIGVAESELQYIDPAFFGGPGGFGGWLTAACELPLTFAPVRGSLRVRLVPQAAVALPTVSRDGRTFTFTIRKGLRFASGEPVTAQSYVDGINRALNPKMHPDDAEAIAAHRWPGEVVGARAVLAGKAATVSGVRARGQRLVFELIRPNAWFPARLASPELLCPVPPNLPVDAEGIGAPFSGGGPYYIATWERGERVIFARNRFYGGTRPQRVDRFELTVAGPAETTLRDIDAGRLDWAEALHPDGPLSVPELAKRYGVNRSQFYVRPIGAVHYLALNTARPLFKGNPSLRRAINFAIDRAAILRVYGPYAGRATDQYLPSIVAGYRDARIYPLKRPDLRTAQALARGHTRSGTAIFYARDDMRGQAVAQIVRENLSEIGLEVEIKTFPQEVALGRMGTRGEPFDIGFFGLSGGLDPAGFLGSLEGRKITATNNLNFSYFDSPRYNRLLARAAALPLGPRRDDAFGSLDVELSKEAAPRVALLERQWGFLFSKRAGCISFVGGFPDFASLCLK